MAGINVNQITSTLAGLPDQALQQYAQMHKNDPYIMSLAVSESNRRKQMRAGAQAPQGMQEQPKVADAALAQMAPEEQGIAALPAQNMQMMADGGIAGYEGYDEGGMAYDQEPVTMMAEGGVARYNGSQSQFVQDLAGIPAAYDKWWQRNREEDAAKAAKEQAMAQRRQEMMDARQKTSFANYLFGSPEQEAEGQAELAQLTKPTGSMPEPGYTRAGMKGDPRLNVPMTQPLPTEKPPAAAGGKAAPGAGGAPRGPAPARAPAPDMSAADRYKAMEKAMGVDGTEREDTERAGLEAAMRKAADDKEARYAKDAAERRKYGEGKEERLAKREAGLGKQKDDLAGLALLETGLAIMSSPGKLAEAVGKSAQTGLRTYSAGLKDLRAAQEKMDELRDQIDEFRRNEDNMTAKERRELMDERNRTEVEIKRLGVAAAAKMTDSKKADMKSIFTADTQERLTGMEITGRENAARIAAGPGYQRNQMLAASQGQEAKVRAEYGKLQAKVMDDLSKNQNFIMANPAQQQVMQTTALRQALMNNPFLAPYAAGIGFSAAPAGGKVYDLTED